MLNTELIYNKIKDNQIFFKTKYQIFGIKGDSLGLQKFESNSRNI